MIADYIMDENFDEKQIISSEQKNSVLTTIDRNKCSPLRQSPKKNYNSLFQDEYNGNALSPYKNMNYFESI